MYAKAQHSSGALPRLPALLLMQVTAATDSPCFSNTRMSLALVAGRCPVLACQ